MAEKEFYVDEDLCTGCGDCWTNMPENFQDNGDDVAEAHNQEVKDAKKLEEVMKNCPGGAILWKK